MADQTTDEIERQIEAERHALARSLDELQGRFSPDALMDVATTYLRENGTDVLGAVGKQAKDNPMAVGLTAVGLAWLIAGPAPKRAPSQERQVAQSVRRNRNPEHVPQPAFAAGSDGTVPGFRQEQPQMAGFDARLEAAVNPTREPTLWEKISGAAQGVSTKAEGAWNSMTHPNETTANFSDLRSQLADGTEHLSEAARDRVIKARAAAVEAQEKLAARAGDYATAGRDAYGAQPLIGGLVAFGIGALIGAALPRTRQENAYLGAYRDRALAEAEHIFREETQKLKMKAEQAGESLKSAAAEELDAARRNMPTASEAINEAEAAATRVKAKAETAQPTN